MVAIHIFSFYATLFLMHFFILSFDTIILTKGISFLNTVFYN
jgi:hypothetical protein